jgi:hypothetical protein
VAKNYRHDTGSESSLQRSGQILRVAQPFIRECTQSAMKLFDSSAEWGINLDNCAFLGKLTVIVVPKSPAMRNLLMARP